VIGQTCFASSHRRDTACVGTMVVCPLVECKQEGEVLKATHRHQCSDGRALPVEVHAARIAIGGKAYVVESIRDLSEVARISHEQRLSELGLLAAGVAHEIHNPLASIRLVVQGLTRELRAGGSDLAKTGQYLELIDGEIDNCITVTRRLLLLSRQPEGRRQLVDVVAAIDDALRLLDYDAQARGIRQTFQPPASPIHVLADEGEVRMILLNLLQNAHHAMPQGGAVTVRAGIHGNEAAIEVADSGCGIAAEHIEHIFDPFFSRRADEVAGTGLGLTIVRNIVERFDGSIDVDSVVGEGATFTVRLPLASAAMAEVQ
jgi:signal transduction histidine kinase